MKKRNTLPHKHIRKAQRMATRLDGMPENITTTANFVGHKVVDKEGIAYGYVTKVHIDESTLGVAGVTAKYGFRKTYFLPRTDIARMTDENVMVATPPLRTSVRVVDIDGHKIGKIKHLNRNTETGDIESIQVSSGVFSSKTISVSSIWGIGKAVTLKMTRAEFVSRT